MKRVIIISICILLGIIFVSLPVKALELNNGNIPEKIRYFGIPSYLGRQEDNLEIYSDIIVVDDGYIVVGSANLNTEIIENVESPIEDYVNQSKGNVDAIIVKYDKDLSTKWFKSFGGGLNDYFSSIYKTNDGGYLVYGRTTSTDGDLMGINENYSSTVNICVKYTSDWNLEYTEIIDGYGEFNSKYEDIIIEGEEGKITDGRIELDTISDGLEGAVSEVNGQEVNSIIKKYDEQNYLQWVKTFDRDSNDSNDRLTSVIETEDGYIFIGSSAKKVTRTLNNRIIYRQDAVILKYKKPYQDILVGNGTNNYEIEIGDTKDLEIMYVPFVDVPQEEIIWISNNEEIATVDKNGKVTGVGVGSTEIKLQIRYKEVNIKINVKAPEEDTVKIDGIRYKILSEDEKTVEVIQKITDETEIKIPNKIQIEGVDYTVKRIGVSAFEGQVYLKSIQLPETLESIGNVAFHNCCNLTSIDIPDNVKIIGTQSFFGCTELTNIKLSNKLENIEYGAFSWCNKISNIELPESLISIGNSAFSYCTNLKTIIIPEGIEKLSDKMFEKCSNLETVQLPNNLITIGENVFKECTKLNNIQLSNTLQCIESNAFENCTKLTKLQLPESMIELKNNVFYNCTSLRAIIAPETITKIGENVFYNCINLKIYTYKNTYIENYAHLNNIKVVIMDKDDEINASYIKDNYRILNENSKTVEVYGFGKNTTDVVIPYTIKIDGEIYEIVKIADEAFINCINLKSVEIPDNIIEIGESAFEYCYNLSEISLPNSVKTIGDRAFYNCINLTNIKLPDEMQNMGTEVFSFCENLNNVVLPEGITSITEDMFSACESLSNIKLPSTLNKIEDYAFVSCFNLTNIELPSSLNSIGYMAFTYCSGLEKITIPENVSSIGDYAFTGCTKLQEITIPKSVTTIGKDILASVKDQIVYVSKGSDAEKYAKAKKYNYNNIYNLNYKIKEDLKITYTGEKIEPEIIVSEDANILLKDVDYEVIYLNNIEAGKAIITISGKGEYKGEKIIEFDILKAENNLQIKCDDVEYGKKPNPKVITNKSNSEVIYYYKEQGKSDDYYTKNIPTKSGKYTLKAVSSETNNYKQAVVTINFVIKEYSNPFIDVKLENWYYEAVKFNYDKGYISGTSPETFSPEDNLTRGMIVTILYRMDGAKKVTDENKFNDVLSTQYYFEAVKWATAKGIVHGYGNGNFGPDDEIRRQDLAVILRNYSKYKGKNIDVKYDLLEFEDSEKISDYANTAMQWAVGKGVITGYTNTKILSPKGTATRAEAASMLYKYCVE